MTFQCIPKCHSACCGIVPIPKKTYKKNRKRIDKKVEKILDLKDALLIITSDGYCAFLNNSKKCIIYSERPVVCKLYGIEPELPCPYVHADGTLRTNTEIKIAQDNINKMVDIAINKLRKYHQENMKKC